MVPQCAAPSFGGWHRSCSAVLRYRPMSAETRHEVKTVVNVLVGVFAILLCVINAAVWTFITGLPLVGTAWMLGAAACVKLQKWSWSPWSVRF